MFHWGVSGLMSTSQQRQKLGFFRKMLHLSEDTYYALLAEYGVKSSKDLSMEQIKELILRFRRNAEIAGLYNTKSNIYKQKYNDLAERKGMATPAQLRKIEAMWQGVSRLKNEQDRQKALQTMIKKITGKDNIRFLTAIDVRKIIKTFENM